MEVRVRLGVKVRVRLGVEVGARRVKFCRKREKRRSYVTISSNPYITLTTARNLT